MDTWKVLLIHPKLTWTDLYGLRTKLGSELYVKASYVVYNDIKCFCVFDFV